MTSKKLLSEVHHVVNSHCSLSVQLAHCLHPNILLLQIAKSLQGDLAPPRIWDFGPIQSKSHLCWQFVYVVSELSCYGTSLSVGLVGYNRDPHLCHLWTWKNVTCDLELGFIFSLCKVWGVLDSRSSSLDSSPTLIVSTVHLHPGVNAGRKLCDGPASHPCIQGGVAILLFPSSSRNWGKLGQYGTL